MLTALVASLLASAAAGGGLEEVDLRGTSRRHDRAIVVGIEAYDHLPANPGAHVEARAFRDLLVGERGVPEDRVVLLLDPDRVALTEALVRAWEGGHRRGVLWLYFAGLEVAPAPDTGSSLLLRDAILDHPGEGNPGSLLIAHIYDQTPGRTVVILDTCDRGAFSSPPERPPLRFAPAPDGRTQLLARGGCEGSPPPGELVFFRVEPTGTWVAVDGKPACTTPCARRLDPGLHQVLLYSGTHPARALGLQVDGPTWVSGVMWGEDEPGHPRIQVADTPEPRAWDLGGIEWLERILDGPEVELAAGGRPEVRMRSALLMLNRSEADPAAAERWRQRARDQLLAADVYGGDYAEEARMRTAWWLRQLGADAEARALVTPELPSPEGTDGSRALVLRALLHLEWNDPGAAYEALHLAATRGRDEVRPLALFGMARLLARAGEHGEARVALEEAHALCASDLEWSWTPRVWRPCSRGLKKAIAAELYGL